MFSSVGLVLVKKNRLNQQKMQASLRVHIYDFVVAHLKRDYICASRFLLVQNYFLLFRNSFSPFVILNLHSILYRFLQTIAVHIVLKNLIGESFYFLCHNRFGCIWQVKVASDHKKLLYAASTFSTTHPMELILSAP